MVPPALEVPGHHHGDRDDGHPGQGHEDGVRAQQRVARGPHGGVGVERDGGRGGNLKEVQNGQPQR